MFITIQFIVSFLIVTFLNPNIGLATDFLINLTFYIIILVLPIFVFTKSFYNIKPFDFLGMKRNTDRGLLFGLLISLFISIIFSVVNRFSIELEILDNKTILMLVGLVLAGIFEEIPFRGFYMKVFGSRFGFWPANLISSAMFAMMHLSRALSEGLFQIGMYFIISLWLGYIYEKSKSLWAPIFVHAYFNLLTAVF